MTGTLPHPVALPPWGSAVCVLQEVVPASGVLACAFGTHETGMAVHTPRSPCPEASHCRPAILPSCPALTPARRFYAASSFCRHDPRLVAPGCLYLASKAEESVIAARALVRRVGGIL
jgi:hypothetical protein